MPDNSDVMQTSERILRSVSAVTGSTVLAARVCLFYDANRLVNYQNQLFKIGLSIAGR